MKSGQNKNQGTEGALETGFGEKVADWFDAHGLDFPWRQTREPYAILVSEVMLQQTRISVVLGKGYYAKFMEKFPDVRALAAASDDELLKAWEGLGYYRRARMLRETGRAVLEKFGGEFPQDEAGLLSLPGIGRYTAGALRAFAFELPAVLVDGNVARVFSRLRNDSRPIDTTDGIKRMWELAASLAHRDRPRAYHSGLMELGQRICKVGKPDCGICPVAGFCQAQNPEKLPVKAKKSKVTVITECAIWSRDAEGRILLTRQENGRREGLWRLPLRDEKECAALDLVEQEMYTITRYRVALSVYQAFSPVVMAGEVWCAADEITGLAMAAPFRRVVERMLTGR